jgi:hypothetical protein
LFSGNGSSNPNTFSLSPYVTSTMGSDAGVANAVNDQGIVVGWDAFGNIDTTGGVTYRYGMGTPLTGHAFIWKPSTPNGTTGTFQDLNTVYASILPAGVVLNDATGINDRGDILCIASGGALHAREFVLITQAVLDGDANLDGTVNIADLSKVLTNYDKTSMHWADGDFDGNGTVDIQDLSKVLTNYDKSIGSGSGAAGVKAVPEPGTWVLLAAALVGWLACARRRSK